MGEECDASLGKFSRGDVGGDTDHAFGSTGSVARGVAFDRQPVNTLIRPNDATLHVEIIFNRQRAVYDRPDARTIIGMNSSQKIGGFWKKSATGQSE